MAQQPITSSPAKRFSLGSIGWWLLIVVSFGLLALLILQLVIRFSTPIPLHRLQQVQDIPLPDALPDSNRTSQNPLVPGKAERFDHFDFQAFDPQTHLLFIVHTGPNPDKQAAVDPKFNPDKDSFKDGNIVVFDTQQNKVVGLINIPLVAGVAVASDLGRVYAGDAKHGIVYSIDERTCITTPTCIATPIMGAKPNLNFNVGDGPDDIEYDQVDHKIFVSDPGTPAMDPANPDNLLPARQSQNLAVIDTLTNKVIAKIQLGNDGSKYGDDVGHNWFDPVSHQEFVVTRPLENLNDPNAMPGPPSFLTVINPITLQIVKSVMLPKECVNPHGMTIDADMQRHVSVAFIACINSRTLVRMDLQKLSPLPDIPFPDNLRPPLAFNADIVRLDHTSHLLFVGCAGGISVFDESGGQLKKLGDYFLGGGSHHTIAINEAAQVLYLPLTSVGGRPVLRIIHYVVNCKDCL